MIAKSEYNALCQNYDKVLELNRQWKKNNSAYILANTKLRKLRIKQAAPKWLSKEQLNEIQHKYQMAKDMETLTGNKYHVDHILPINHPNICGLHVPWNLQVIPAMDNLRKGNRV